MNKPSIRLNRVLEIFIWLAAVGVLVENVLLLQQNRAMHQALDPQITAGAQLEMLTGLTLDGRNQPLELPSPNSKLLIITFSPGCPACQANQEGWKKLAGALEQRGVRVLWFSRDTVEITRDYCMKHGIPFSDTLADPPYRTYVQLGLARVPNTVLVRADGTVEKVWAGRMDQAGWQTMFAYFGQSPVEVGTRINDCESALSQTSVKSCR
jgi:peroxiredoxin